MLALLDQLQTVHSTLDGYAERIQELFSQHSNYEVFSSLPGGGGLLGTSLCGQLGDALARFGAAAVAQALAGTAPVTKRSGKSRHVHIRLACDEVLRTTLQYLLWLRCDFRVECAKFTIGRALADWATMPRGVSSPING